MLKSFNWSIKHSITAIVLLAIIPVAGILVYSAYDRSNKEISKAQLRLAGLAESLAALESLRLESSKDMMLTLSLSGIFTSPSPEPISRMFKNLVDDGIFIDIKLVRNNGEVISTADGPTTLLTSEKRLLESAEQQSRFVVGDFVLSDNDAAGVYTALPLKEQNATLLTSVPLSFHEEILGGDVSPHIQVRFVKPPGQYIIGNSKDHSLTPQWMDRNEFALLKRQKKDSGHYYLITQGQEYLVIFKKLSIPSESNLPFYVLIDIPQSDLTATESASLRRNLLLLVLGTFISLLTALVFSARTLVRPLDRLIDVASRFKQGDLGARTEISKFGGEFKNLANSFNQMATTLETRNQELTKSKTEADAANKAKSAFLANMSHEIRTPMNAIIGLAYLALQSNLTQKQHNYISKIYSSANDLLRIINDILDFSKAEACKIKLENIPFKLDDILDNIANMIIPQARKKGLDIEFIVTKHVPRSLKGDPLRLGQILINLLSNAVKFTSHGKITLTCNVKELLEDSVRLLFSVQDTGIGMSEEAQKKLFKAFSQADDSTTRKFGGTGLGLVISKHLAQMLQGDIIIKSIEGKGTTDELEVRLGLAAEGIQKTEECRRELSGLPILVADDDENFQIIIIEMLEKMGMHPKPVSSGEEALKEIERMSRENPYRVLLIDWKLPGMNGSEATKKIRELDLPVPPVIIMVTAYGRSEVLYHANSSGIDGFLHKPVSPSLLYNTIHDSLAGTDIPSPAPLKPADKDNTAFSGSRILLVEDNIINQQVAHELLCSKGAEVEIASDGRQALDMLAETKSGSRKPYELVLMDLQMPEMDGLEATHNIRSDEYFNNLPIIAMTAHAMQDELDLCLDAGMNDHISKPIDIESLYRKVSYWLGKVELNPEEMPLGSVPQPLPQKTSHYAPEQSETRWSSQTYDDISAQTNSDAADLADLLPEFTINEALKRVAGNVPLYLKLLSHFCREYGTRALELSKLIEAGKPEDAILFVHTIKGLSGNLGMTGLFETSKELEHLLRSSREFKGPEVKEKINAFAHALDQCLAQATRALKKTNQNATPEKQSELAGRSFEREKLALLKNMLYESDAKAVELFHEIEPDLKTFLPEASLSLLRNNIENFDFDEAYQLIIPLIPE